MFSALLIYTFILYLQCRNHKIRPNFTNLTSNCQPKSRLAHRHIHLCVCVADTKKLQFVFMWSTLSVIVVDLSCFPVSDVSCPIVIVYFVRP